MTTRVNGNPHRDAFRLVTRIRTPFCIRMIAEWFLVILVPKNRSIATVTVNHCAALLAVRIRGSLGPLSLETRRSTFCPAVSGSFRDGRSDAVLVSVFVRQL